MPSRKPIDYDTYTTEELLAMSKKEATNGLNEQQQRFCEYYVTSYNTKIALLKAGYSEGATARGYLLRHNPRAQRYIQWLKARILKETVVTGADIIDHWVRIAFADMTDFVHIYRNSIGLKPAAEMDGQLVKSIKSGRDGISIELYDKLKALDSLAKYTADMPKDYKQILDERKQELLEQEFELKKKMHDIENREGQSDGFLEALSKSAEVIWKNEEEI